MFEMLYQQNTKRLVAMGMLLVMLFAILAIPQDALAKGLWDDFKVDYSQDGPVVQGGEANDANSAWKTILDKYRYFIAGVAAIATVTMVALMILNFGKLAASSGNPTERSKAIAGIIWTGIATVGLGSVALITSVFYHAI